MLQLAPPPEEKGWTSEGCEVEITPIASDAISDGRAAVHRQVFDLLRSDGAADRRVFWSISGASAVTTADCFESPTSSRTSITDGVLARADVEAGALELLEPVYHHGDLVVARAGGMAPCSARSTPRRSTSCVFVLISVATTLLPATGEEVASVMTPLMVARNSWPRRGLSSARASAAKASFIWDDSILLRSACTSRAVDISYDIS